MRRSCRVREWTMSAEPLPGQPPLRTPGDRPAEAEERTARDFVKGLCLQGVSTKSILAVALCTRWRNQMDEVRHWLELRGDIWRGKRRESHASLHS